MCQLDDRRLKTKVNCSLKVGLDRSTPVRVERHPKAPRVKARQECSRRQTDRQKQLSNLLNNDPGTHREGTAPAPGRSNAADHAGAASGQR